MDRHKQIQFERERLQRVRLLLQELASAHGVPATDWALADLATATLLRWDVDPNVRTAALLTPLIRYGANPEALARRYGGQAVALAGRLIQWQTNLPAPTKSLERSELILALRRLMREAHLERPHFPLVLLLMAYHDALLRSIAPELQRPVQIAVAEATKEIWAPLAEMLGMWQVGSRWLDLAMRMLDPDLFHTFMQWVERTRKRSALRASPITREKQALIEQNLAYVSFKASLTHLCAEWGVRARVQRKISRLSTFIRRAEEGESLGKVMTRLSIRVFCQREHECYVVLGLVHKLGRRLAPRFSQRFDDFIAAPQVNGYRAIHTAIEYTHGKQKVLLEIRILSTAMNQVNLHGATRTQALQLDNPTPSWRYAAVPGLVRTQDIGTSANEVYLFTPRGQLVLLPGGAVLDFAYHVHSDLGNSLISAQVNGEDVPFNFPLKNGDLIHLKTSAEAPGPDVTWLQLCAWERTRVKIQRALRQKTDLTRPGQALFQRTFFQVLDHYRKVKGYDLQISARQIEELLTRIAKTEGHPDTDSLYKRIEHERPYAVLIVQQLISLLLSPRLMTPTGGSLPYSPDRIRFCHACWPAPGEVLQAHEHKKDYAKLIVHSTDCRLNIPQERLVPVQWGEELQDMVLIRVQGEDRVGLLEDVLSCVYSCHGASLREVTAKAHEDGHADITLITLLQQPTQRFDLLRRIESVPQVHHVQSETANQTDLYPLPSTPQGIPFTEAIAQTRLDFFDRVEPLSALNQWLNEPEQMTRPFLLRGQRRVGKTSLLLYWQNQLIAESRHRVLPVYVTLQSLSEFTALGLCRLIADAVFTTLRQSAPPQAATEEPFVWLSRCLKEASQTVKPKRLLLMLDEFAVLQEECERGDLSDQIFRNVRYILFERREINWLLVVQEEYFHWDAGPANELYKLIADYPLREMGPAWVAKMVQAYLLRLGLTMEDRVKARLLSLTGSNPYLVKRLCMDMYLRHRQGDPGRIQFDESDLDFAVNLMLHRANNDLEHYFRYLRPVSVSLLRALAAEPTREWISLTRPQEWVLQQGYTTELIQKALKDLTQLGLVEVREGPWGPQVQFLVGLIREWAKSLDARQANS